MTDEQALAKARQLWGESACVRASIPGIDGPRFLVGKQTEKQFKAYGAGFTWEQAFAFATRPERRPTHQMVIANALKRKGA